MNQISGMFCTIKNYFLALSSDSTECSFTRVKKAAFTLAEVLITLGIIGVVAAMTMPVLISNHQKRVYVTQLKKAASTLENALRMMAVSEGVVNLRETECGSFYPNIWGEDAASVCVDNVAKQMNILKTNSLRYCRDENWCRYDTYPEKTSDTLDSFGVPAIMTADGITYLFACGSFPYIYADINGTQKGPNEGGRDIFFFYLDFETGKIYPGGAKDSPYSYSGYVTCTPQNYSSDCTAQVLATGKMDY